MHNPNIHDDFQNLYIRKMHCESIFKPPISIVIEVLVYFFLGGVSCLFAQHLLSWIEPSCRNPTFGRVGGLPLHS